MRSRGHSKGFQGPPNPWVTSNSKSTTTTVFRQWFKRPVPSSLFPSTSTTAAATTTTAAATAWSGTQVKRFYQVSRPYLSVQLSSQMQWLIVSPGFQLLTDNSAISPSLMTVGVFYTCDFKFQILSFTIWFLRSRFQYQFSKIRTILCWKTVLLMTRMESNNININNNNSKPPRNGKMIRWK